MYRRVGQGYLSLGRSLARLVDDYEASGADWHDVERSRFAVQALTSLLAPTNTLTGNPAAIKRAIETGGRSVARGLGHLLDDLRQRQRGPTDHGAQRRLPLPGCTGGRVRGLPCRQVGVPLLTLLALEGGQRLVHPQKCRVHRHRPMLAR